MNLEGGKGGGLGEGAGRDQGWLLFPKLTDGYVEGSRISGFGSKADVDEVRLITRLPFGLSLFIGIGLEEDALDAGTGAGGESEVVLASCDELVVGGELPFSAGRVLEL